MVIVLYSYCIVAALILYGYNVYVFSDGYMRDHLVAEGRQIENQIGTTLKEAPFQKSSVMQPIKVNYLYVFKSKVKHESRQSALTK